MIKRKFPNGMLGASCLISDPKSTSVNAPARPINTPIAFKMETRSFIYNAERINSIIGEIVIITALFMGVERLSPLKNINIFITIPKIAHAIILGQSSFFIRSLGPLKLISRNKRKAPLTLKKIKPNGLMYAGITSLAIIWLRAYIVLAPKAARIASVLFLSMDSFQCLRNCFLTVTYK